MNKFLARFIARGLVAIALMLGIPCAALAQTMDTQTHSGIELPKATVEIQAQGTPEIGSPVEVRLTLPDSVAGLDVTNLSVRPTAVDTAKIRFDEEYIVEGNGSYTLRGRFLSEGELQLEPLTVRGSTESGGQFEIETNPVTIQVATLGDAPENPADYTATMEPPPNYLRWALTAGGVLAALAVLAALLLWAAKRRGRSAVPQEAPAPPPLDEAWAAVRALAKMETYDTRGAKVHFTSLSHIVRRYCERQFKFPAMEMSEEAVIEYGRRYLAQRTAIKTLAPVMENASLVKYAQARPSREEAEESVRLVTRFLESEEARLEREWQQARAEEMRRTRQQTNGSKEAA